MLLQVYLGAVVTETQNWDNFHQKSKECDQFGYFDLSHLLHQWAKVQLHSARKVLSTVTLPSENFWM